MKMGALDGIESEWRALYDVQRATSYYPSYSSWMAYGTSFFGTIIENLQVSCLVPPQNKSLMVGLHSTEVVFALRTQWPQVRIPGSIKIFIYCLVRGQQRSNIKPI